MSIISYFTKAELSAAIARGVRQCVVIGSQALSIDPSLQVFAVGECEATTPDSTTFVPTEFASENLAEALEKSDFDKLKATVFVWVGTAGYRTVDAMVASLAFIASLPKGSAVLFDYAVERTAVGALTQTAMDALASKLSEASGTVKYLIQPQAVVALLKGVGFHQIVDLPASTGHLVSAVV
jgi:O-methyltransferase involved in polyketide biosynthesis